MEIENLNVVIWIAWIGGVLILASIGIAFTIIDAIKVNRDE